MTDRPAAAQGAFAALGAQVAVITDPANRRWLTGFTGSSGQVILRDGVAELITDGRYTIQAQAEVRPGVRVTTDSRRGAARLAEHLAGHSGPVAVEADHLTVAQMADLERDLSRNTWVATRGVLANLRAVKDSDELAAIRQAFAVADRAFGELLPQVQPGARELDLALSLEGAIRRHEGCGLGFGSIVVSGPRCALPHGQPSGRQLAVGDLVTIDWGATVGGYTSDCTRTLAVGQLHEPGRQIYQVVKAAMEAAIAAARPQTLGKDVHAAARAVIEAAGFGADFVHGTGHGLGLEIHEAPALGARSEDRLQVGMVVTFEPGIYIEGYGGVRIEQTGIITEGPVEILSGLPTELQIC
ncbi:MAG: M24 family metallopeptidase [Sulfobacillus sp.]